MGPCLLSSINKYLGYVESFKDIDKIFSFNRHRRSVRWEKILDKHVKNGSVLERLLRETRDSSLPYTGNRTKNRQVHNAPHNNDEIIAAVQTIVQRHGPDNVGNNGSLFWVWVAEAEDSEKLEPGASSPISNKNGTVLMTFPAKYPYYKTVDTVQPKNRLRNAQFALLAVQTPSSKGPKTVVVRDDGGGGGAEEDSEGTYRRNSRRVRVVQFRQNCVRFLDILDSPEAH